MISYNVSVFLVLSGLYFLMVHGPSRWNDPPPETFATMIFKVLPMTSLISMVAYTKPEDEEHRRYKMLMTLGLLFSTGGDVALVWKSSFFKLGLLLFAAAHVLYTASFRFSPAGLPSGLFSMMSACVVFMFFQPVIKERLMQWLVALYVALIFTMFWRAHVRWNKDPRWDNMCASLGAIVFIISDFLLAFCKWHFQFHLGSVYIMVSYYIAQLFMALSVTLYSLPQSEDFREKKRG